jgi:hypothetical protein
MPHFKFLPQLLRVISHLCFLFSIHEAQGSLYTAPKGQSVSDLVRSAIRNAIQYQS